ncbi:hypothetical protein CUC43_32875 (plasmid) [Bacillus thuringiensis LM1212]|uniref:hypothetical protein n=1 Tax=Bacillus cereus group TaxID=86661 RepID=UPI0003FF702A|nr:MULTISPECIES: hypothetical protein [Bacillus cereus group]AXY11399.1 hypothetical protein CUC43_32875 [Bacillus thuringiensis LM1212]QDF27308.1 hypothetical protein FJR70_31535 [Bacillus tropicus]QUG99175.1 hypothetical protein HCM98_30570 [Bacillus tropicus]
MDHIKKLACSNHVHFLGCFYLLIIGLIGWWYGITWYQGIGSWMPWYQESNIAFERADMYLLMTVLLIGASFMTGVLVMDQEYKKLTILKVSYLFGLSTLMISSVSGGFLAFSFFLGYKDGALYPVFFLVTGIAVGLQIIRIALKQTSQPENNTLAHE